MGPTSFTYHCSLMSRLIPVLVLIVVVTAATGTFDLVSSSECTKPSEGDDSHGSCPPDCYDCACCARVSPTLPPDLATNHPLESGSTLQCEASRRPLCPPPHEVFHVPKPALA